MRLISLVSMIITPSQSFSASPRCRISHDRQSWMWVSHKAGRPGLRVQKAAGCLCRYQNCIQKALSCFCRRGIRICRSHGSISWWRSHFPSNPLRLLPSCNVCGCLMLICIAPCVLTSMTVSYLAGTPNNRFKFYYAYIILRLQLKRVFKATFKRIPHLIGESFYKLKFLR